MGQKVSPKAMRLGITRTWHSKWFADGKEYAAKVKQDVLLRKYVIKTFREAGVDRVEIERNGKKININVHTAKPGMVIGRGGAGIEDLKKKIHKLFLSNPSGIRLSDIVLNISEVSRPNLSAQILVQSMAMEIEKRMPFKRVMKQAIGRVEKAGALGVKVMMSGRLNGAEIARRESLTAGKLPLQTLRADIDYSRGAAHTTYGAVGIKVWIYKGEVFNK